MSDYDGEEPSDAKRRPARRSLACRARSLLVQTVENAPHGCNDGSYIGRTTVFVSRTRSEAF